MDAVCTGCACGLGDVMGKGCLWCGKGVVRACGEGCVNMGWVMGGRGMAARGQYGLTTMDWRGVGEGG